MKKYLSVFIIVLSISVQADSGSVRAAVDATADAASNLGFEYAELVTLFGLSASGAASACKLLPKLDRIRDDAHYKFSAIEARQEIRALRQACYTNKEPQR